MFLESDHTRRFAMGVAAQKIVMCPKDPFSGDQIMEKGKSFELEVKALIEYMLKMGDLALIPERATTFHRKGYFSKDRNTEIITDVSLEVFREGQDRPFLILIWECKDYNSSVPVDDVEEFHAKLEQIGVHKIKGTMITRYGFQSGAITFAESKGIGLARVLPDGAVSMILESVQYCSKDRVLHGLTEQNTEHLTSRYHGLTSSGEAVIEIHDQMLLEIQKARLQN